MSDEFRLMPEQASSIAPSIDRLYTFLWGVSGLMMVLIGVLILYFAIKYRRSSTADRRPASTHFFAIEAAWIAGPFIVSMIIFFWAAKLYLVQSNPPAGAMEITGVGKQWMWKFQHPDGRAEINDLHVPLGQPIKVRLISEDVIHSMFVPAFRVKQDVLPGRYTTIWFEPTKPGKYHLFCAEYCGNDHSVMRGYVYVMEPARYQQFLAGQGTESVGAGNEKLLERFRCVTCHQGGGVVSRGPPLEGLLERKVTLSDGRTMVADENYVRESILRPQAKVVAGHPSIMPSFEDQVDEEGLNQLIREIKALGRGDNTEPSKPDDKLKLGPEQRPNPDAQEATP